MNHSGTCSCLCCLDLRDSAYGAQAVVGQVLPKVSSPDIEDMVPDSGAIIQKDVRKMAVYKDEAGGTHAYSAVCPHLGCLLQVCAVLPPRLLDVDRL